MGADVSYISTIISNGYIHVWLDEASYLAHFRLLGNLSAANPSGRSWFMAR